MDFSTNHYREKQSHRNIYPGRMRAFFNIFNYYVSGLPEAVIDASANNIENVEAGQSKEKLMKDIPQ